MAEKNTDNINTLSLKPQAEDQIYSSEEIDEIIKAIYEKRPVVFSLNIEHSGGRTNVFKVLLEEEKYLDGQTQNLPRNSRRNRKINFSKLNIKISLDLENIYNNNFKNAQIQQETIDASKEERKYSIGTTFRSFFGSYVNNLLVRLIFFENLNSLYFWENAFKKFWNGVFRAIEKNLFSSIFKNQDNNDFLKDDSAYFQSVSTKEGVIYNLITKIYCYAKEIFLNNSINFNYEQENKEEMLKKLERILSLTNSQLQSSRAIMPNNYSAPLKETSLLQLIELIYRLVKSEFIYKEHLPEIIKKLAVDYRLGNIDNIRPEQFLFAAIIYRIFEKNAEGVNTELFFLKLLYSFLEKSANKGYAEGTETFIIMQSYENHEFSVSRISSQYESFQKKLKENTQTISFLQFGNLSNHEDTILGIDYLIQYCFHSRNPSEGNINEETGYPEFLLVQVKNFNEVTRLDKSSFRFIFPLRTKKDLKIFQDTLNSWQNKFEEYYNAIINKSTENGRLQDKYKIEGKMRRISKNIERLKNSAERMTSLTLLEQYRLSIPVIIILPSADYIETADLIQQRLEAEFNKLLTILRTPLEDYDKIIWEKEEKE